MTERQARQIVYQRSGGVCEVCDQARGSNWHHRVAKGQGGAWDPANGLHVCGSGTTGCHGWITAHPLEAQALGLALPAWTDGRPTNPEEHPVYYRRWGQRARLTSEGMLELVA